MDKLSIQLLDREINEIIMRIVEMQTRKKYKCEQTLIQTLIRRHLIRIRIIHDPRTPKHQFDIQVRMQRQCHVPIRKIKILLDRCTRQRHLHPLAIVVQVGTTQFQKTYEAEGSP